MSIPMLHRGLDCLYSHSKDDRIAPRYFDNRTSFGGKSRITFAVESPIDALSYRTIHACRGDAWAVVSCAGATVPNALMRLTYDRRQSFVVALDNDPAGERGWEKAWDETVDWSGFKISSVCPKHKDRHLIERLLARLERI